jgi:hypothetical protein
VPRLREREAGLPPPYPRLPGVASAVCPSAVCPSAVHLGGEGQQVFLALGRVAAAEQPVRDAFGGQLPAASSSRTPASSSRDSISAGSAYTR